MAQLLRLHTMLPQRATFLYSFFFFSTANGSKHVMHVEIVVAFFEEEGKNYLNEVYKYLLSCPRVEEIVTDFLPEIIFEMNRF